MILKNTKMVPHPLEKKKKLFTKKKLFKIFFVSNQNNENFFIAIIFCFGEPFFDIFET